MGGGENLRQSSVENSATAAASRHPRSRGEKTQDLYAALFGVSVRTIKGWIAIGRDARPPERPPLDEPARMKDWYARHMTNRVPDRLVEMAAAIARGATPSFAPASAAIPFASAPAPSSDSSAGPLFAAVTNSARPADTAATTPRLISASGAGGFTATLTHLREAAAITGERYARLAADPTKEPEAEHAHRIWSKLTKELLAYEKSAQDLLQSSGQSWASADVTAVVEELHAPLRDAVLSLYDRIASRLEQLPSREERSRIYRAEALRLFAALCANKFTASPAPSSAAA